MGGDDCDEGKPEEINGHHFCGHGQLQPKRHGRVDQDGKETPEKEGSLGIEEIADEALPNGIQCAGGFQIRMFAAIVCFCLPVEEGPESQVEKVSRAEVFKNRKEDEGLFNNKQQAEDAIRQMHRDAQHDAEGGIDACPA